MDIWTASNGSSYLGVTIHWCDTKWVTHARLLGFIAMPPFYTGYNIFLALRDLLKDFGLLYHILSITTNSADINRLACELLKKAIKKDKASHKSISTKEKEEEITEAPDHFIAANN